MLDSSGTPLELDPAFAPERRASAPAAPERTDPAGRDRLTRNVVASWACHFVFIMAGFVLPRMIDHGLGQAALGVWDFCWSLVSYFGLAQFGIVASVNRFVAKYRVENDIEGINRVVSSISCVLLVVGLVVLTLTIGAGLIVPDLLATRLGEHAREAQWVIILLGLSLVVELATAGIGGVVTGFHRWDLHNAIHAGAHVVGVTGMVTVLFLGGSLWTLALMYLIGEIAGRLTRCVLAYRLCPGLRVRLGLASWSEARKTIAFGGKSFVPDISNLLLNQTTSVMILAYLGPAALAIYSRPKALVRHVGILVAKFAYVLTPTASSLQALGRDEDLRTLFLKASRVAAFLAIPMVLTLAIMGEPLLRGWMGSGYANGWTVLAILALGQLGAILQMPALSVLAGMNLHGRPGAANLAAALVSVAAVAIAVAFYDAGLQGIALAVAVPTTLVNALYIPARACRCLALPLRVYLLRALGTPLACALPFALSLVLIRVQLSGHPFKALAAGAIVGTLILAPLYWRYALPITLKRGLFVRLGLARFAGAPAGG